MKNSKFLLASVVGTVTFFLLGWLVWGTLLKSFMDSNMGLTPEVAAQVFKPEMEFNWIAMIASCLGKALLYATILVWGGFTSTAAGMRAGAIIGLLTSVMFDMLWLAMSNLMTTPSVLVDIVAATVVGAVGGAVIGMVLAK